VLILLHPHLVEREDVDKLRIKTMLKIISLSMSMFGLTKLFVFFFFKGKGYSMLFYYSLKQKQGIRSELNFMVNMI
jgi:hypothetical protein